MFFNFEKKRKYVVLETTLSIPRELHKGRPISAHHRLFNAMKIWLTIAIINTENSQEIVLKKLRVNQSEVVNVSRRTED